MLFSWVSSNRRLHSLHVSPSSSDRSWELPWETIQPLLASLEASLTDNYSLTYAYVDAMWECPWEWHRIAHKVRRNSGLLRWAAAFVLGSELTQAKTAFQLVSWHPQLLGVVQRMGTLDRVQAEQKIQESQDRLLH